MFNAAVYRFRQGILSLFAPLRPLDLSLAARYLNSEQMALFERFRRGEQLHSLNVLRSVLAQGETPPELAVAALLHDIGKVRFPLRTWQKTLAVLVRAFAPPLFQRWSAGEYTDLWRRPFVVRVYHPIWGAELAAKTGAAPTTLWLIAHHQDKAVDWARHPAVELLRRLQAADNRN
ncbi:MAG: HD domain-containing protein [Chloroflexi bacterium]|nr:HD domain-containing protein [Chloroflexota bacterium]